MGAPVSDSLAALRDIHLPAPVAFWPPAPGWWGLAALVLMVVLAGIYLLRVRRRQRESWNRAAADELARLEIAFAEQGDGAELAVGLSSLLRRAALVRYPEMEVAALHGDAWSSLLCQDPTGAGARSPRTASEFTRAAYRGNSEGSPDEWIDFARSWIEEAA